MTNLLVEFYEYFIHDLNSKSTEQNIVYKFGDFTDSDFEKCGKVGIDGSLKERETNLSSCDPLESLSGGTYDRELSLYDIDNLYDNYKNFFVKYSTEEILNKSSIDNILHNLRSAYFNQKKYLNELSDNDISAYVELNETMAGEMLLKSNMNDAIILKLKINKTDKIILIGDLHGSFHAFFRILCRLHRYDIFNLETFVLAENYKIIFLGDILDRGEYTLDIIFLIFKLISINNKTHLNIIYNRGNHETINVFYTGGSAAEFEKKFADEIHYKEFLNKYLRLLNILPSAVLLSIGDANVWCCHGGFPRNYINDEFNHEKNAMLITNTQMSSDIKWSDFGSSIEAQFEQSGRGPGVITYSNSGTEGFIKKNNITFIIRGHQDSYGNSFLFHKNGERKNISAMEQNINGLYYNNFINGRTHGAIARLDLNNFDPNYFKVLTISTNSDKGRYLQSDSFILLRQEDSNINDFKNCLKPSEVKKIAGLLSRKSPINRADIFKNKLNIISDILDIINKIIDRSVINKSATHDDKLSTMYIQIKVLFDYLCIKFKKIKDRLNKLMPTFGQSNPAQEVVMASQYKSLLNYIDINDTIIGKMKILFNITENKLSMSINKNSDPILSNDQPELQEINNKYTELLN